MSASKMFIFELSKWTWRLGLYVVCFADDKDFDIQLSFFIFNFRFCSGLEKGFSFINRWKR